VPDNEGDQLGRGFYRNRRGGWGGGDTRAGTANFESVYTKTPQAQKKRSQNRWRGWKAEPKRGGGNIEKS